MRNIAGQSTVYSMQFEGHSILQISALQLCDIRSYEGERGVYWVKAESTIFI